MCAIVEADLVRKTSAASSSGRNVCVTTATHLYLSSHFRLPRFKFGVFQRARPHHQTSTRLTDALSRHPIRFKSTFLHTREYLFEYVLCHTFSSWKPVLLGPNTCRSVYERIVCLRLNCGSDSARMPSSNFLANITVCVAWQTSCGEASNFLQDTLFTS